MPALSSLAERWLDQLVLAATGSNDAGADFALLYTLPDGLGDVALIELELSVTTIATMVATPEELGAMAQIADSQGNVVDIVGVQRWSKLGATTLGSYFSPDPLVIWRQNEVLVVRGPELDTNASPTGDVGVRVKVVRVREMAGGGHQPIQLVR